MRVLALAALVSLGCHLLFITLLPSGSSGADDARNRDPLQVLLRPWRDPAPSAPPASGQLSETLQDSLQPPPPPPQEQVAVPAPQPRPPLPLPPEPIEEVGPELPAFAAVGPPTPLLPPAPAIDAEALQARRVRGFELNILAWLQQHRHYPRSARRARLEGTAEVRFTLDRMGRLLGSELSNSSGHAVLDRAALDTVKRAEPYPQMPTELEVEQLELELPVEFRLTATSDQG